MGAKHRQISRRAAGRPVRRWLAHGLELRGAPRLPISIFTPGENAPGGRGGGLGLGLAIVKELVSLHNGTIAVCSEGLDKGSEFTLRFPLAQRGTATGSDGT